ncbi:BapA/Bap/LapF family prefix-like domain-containing protein, partial [Thiopseudomonas alkaliphila]|uniref:BapA/Bap/LapF family prefix-like domain-containing protein n=1 Tax=Thiopseudomonas alkaliphila TaxID=1697053 RepID=UPI002577EB50
MIGKSIGVVEKETGQSSKLDWSDTVTLNSTSVIKMPFGPEDVSSYEINGENLIINLKSGSSITVLGFFTQFEEDEKNELVLEDDNGVLWWGQFDAGLSEFTFTEISALDVAAGGAAGAATGGVPDWVKFGLAVLAVGGIIANESHGKSKHKKGLGESSENPGQDSTAPDAPENLEVTNTEDADGKTTTT